jgi:hypothetical protein
MLSLLVLVTIVSIFLSWAAAIHRGHDRERAQRRKDAALIARAGGSVKGWSDARFVRVGSLELWPTNDHGGALSVDFEGSDFTDPDVVAAAAAFLDGNRNIEYLRFRGCNGTDRCLSRLGPLERLHTIEIRDSDASDAGVEAVSQLPSLQRLSMTGTNATAASIDRLRESLPQYSISSE